jgi:CheY-like chemotaxis protein
VTANVTPEDMARCKEVGMDDFMAKPVTLKRLDEILRKWLPAPLAGSGA